MSVAWASVEGCIVQGNSQFGVSGRQSPAVSVQRQVGERSGRPCLRGLDFCIFYLESAGKQLGI